jgi:thioredoxin-like negative regulator of GroEL
MIEILYFTAAWCSPCRAFGPIVERLSSISDGSYSIRKIDVDADSGTTVDHSIKSVPTMIFLKDGKEIMRKTGALSETGLVEVINEAKKS